ncbi:hypothetical protein CERSUDRAFT_120024 [Gelatoporia subvermispora B]|uniref:DUF6533 domain-containing protein n=1 Tax=Ceriporiopsis subvermispora (strain B) TaxID=914234 RepID=M2Q313_CERS8|nr:hypothetical protein CERSUDRAFT_120024 [Gelatoporia subvermispora B]
MSNRIGSVADQIVSFINSFMISGYTSMAGAAILFYDIISTIPEEVHFLWGQKRTSTIVIFHMNRWLTGTYMVLIVASQCLTSWTIPRSDLCFPLNNSSELSAKLQAISCVTLNYTTCTIALCIYTIWAAFSAIRVYALTGGNRLLSLVVALLNLVSVGTNAYYYFHSNDWQLSTFPLIGRQCVDYVYISVATNLSGYQHSSMRYSGGYYRSTCHLVEDMGHSAVSTRT